jgi:molybdate transport repressor ModE-like protein
MGNSQPLDLDLLRTLALIAKEGSFTRAAQRVGRTQSAVPLQMQRLEAVVGHSLLLRGKGGGFELTAEGQYLVERSRELLALTDEILGSLRAPLIRGTVRLGSSDDIAAATHSSPLRRDSSGNRS